MVIGIHRHKFVSKTVWLQSPIPEFQQDEWNSIAHIKRELDALAWNKTRWQHLPTETKGFNEGLWRLAARNKLKVRHYPRMSAWNGDVETRKCDLRPEK